MGFLVLIVLTLTSAMACGLASASALRDRSSLERMVAALVLWIATRLLCVQATGYAGVLWPVPLALTSLAVDAALVLASVRSAGRAELGRVLRHDLGAPWRALRDSLTQLEPAVVVVLAGVGMLALQALVAWTFRSWTWDGLWYHSPITHLAVQDGTLAWPATDDYFVQGYPRNVELLATWGCVFPRDGALEDAAQIPFAVLGALVVAAWARRLDAPRPLALAVGAAWLAMPPVYLQVATSYVDVACGAAFVTAFYFATARADARSYALAMIALGLYVGSKYSGAFHLAMLGPFVALRLAVALVRGRGGRVRLLAWSLGGTLVALAVSAPKYVQNWLVTANPLWPFRSVLPVLGRVSGPMHVAQMYDAPEGTPLSFFRREGDMTRMLDSWWFVWDHGVFTPDVRAGGFGAVFRWLLLPCVLAVAADALRLRDWRRTAPIAALFVASLVVPAPWWARYTLGASVAALVAFARVHGELRPRVVRLAASALFAGLLLLDVWRVRPGVAQSPFPELWTRARQAGRAERNALHFNVTWPYEHALARETELQQGDVVAYDESVLFLGEFFPSDYRARVVYVPSDADPETYVERLRRAGARWAGVRSGSYGERALALAGGRLRFREGSTAIYDTPWAPRAARR